MAALTAFFFHEQLQQWSINH